MKKIIGSALLVAAVGFTSLPAQAYTVWNVNGLFNSSGGHGGTVIGTVIWSDNSGGFVGDWHLTTTGYIQETYNSDGTLNGSSNGSGYETDTTSPNGFQFYSFVSDDGSYTLTLGTDPSLFDTATASSGTLVLSDDEFVANEVGPLSRNLASGTVTTAGQQAVVAEPSSLALLGTAVIAFCTTARRRVRQRTR